jgi:serine/threonine-protein kinase RsbW
MPDEVRLVMPADPEFLRLARVTAMGLASRLSFTLDEIDDLRIGIDELLFALIGIHGREGSVQIRYTLLPQGLEVVGTGVFPDNPPIHTLTELSELILAAVSDEHSLSVNGESPTFRLLKRRTET